MKINRIWVTQNERTFEIKPIKKLCSGEKTMRILFDGKDGGNHTARYWCYWPTTIMRLKDKIISNPQCRNEALHNQKIQKEIKKWTR